LKQSFPDIPESWYCKIVEYKQNGSVYRVSPPQLPTKTLQVKLDAQELKQGFVSEESLDPYVESQFWQDIYNQKDLVKQLDTMALSIGKFSQPCIGAASTSSYELPPQTSYGIVFEIRGSNGEILRRHS
jgi:hypothetical protein